MFSSSNWLGHYSFTVAIRVQIPLGIKFFDFMANITQLVRVLDCGSRSRRFESCCSPP